MDHDVALGNPVGWLWTFWSGDVLPSIPVLPGLSILPALLEDIKNGFSLDEDGVSELFSSGHIPYVARLGSSPVAYGWSASHQTFFGEPSIAFAVPRANCYLRDFMTLPASRGLGIYPRMLQKIIETETGQVERFWIIHEHSNQASAKGIGRAGFERVAEICSLADGSLGPIGSGERGVAGAELLGLPLLIR